MSRYLEIISISVRGISVITVVVRGSVSIITVVEVLRIGLSVSLSHNMVSSIRSHGSTIGRHIGVGSIVVSSGVSIGDRGNGTISIGVSVDSAMGVELRISLSLSLSLGNDVVSGRVSVDDGLVSVGNGLVSVDMRLLVDNRLVVSVDNGFGYLDGFLLFHFGGFVDNGSVVDNGLVVSVDQRSLVDKGLLVAVNVGSSVSISVDSLDMLNFRSIFGGDSSVGVLNKVVLSLRLSNNGEDKKGGKNLNKNLIFSRIDNLAALGVPLLYSFYPGSFLLENTYEEVHVVNCWSGLELLERLGKLRFLY